MSSYARGRRADSPKEVGPSATFPPSKEHLRSMNRQVPTPRYPGLRRLAKGVVFLEHCQESDLEPYLLYELRPQLHFLETVSRIGVV